MCSEGWNFFKDNFCEQTNLLVVCVSSAKDVKGFRSVPKKNPAFLHLKNITGLKKEVIKRLKNRKKFLLFQKMWIFILFCASLTSLTQVHGQEDNFKCPDEFEGFYPHLSSCDKYWHCRSGKAHLKLCGNGLAFDDSDTSFNTENCDYFHSVNCGKRTVLEPPISAPNCPRLFGTFPDPEDCTSFFNCRAGLFNKYSCAPGLAFDPEDRVCKWADQVAACKNLSEGEEQEESGKFKCPSGGPIGIFTKHAHPEDCRQYYVCISGTPREYGCPLGTVFKVGLTDTDGKCADPEDVAECTNYYGSIAFDKQDLVKAGVDPEAVGAEVAAKPSA